MVVASCPPTETPTRKLKKNFRVEIPRESIQILNILNDFESSQNSAIQNKNSSLGLENPKILGIQPIYGSLNDAFLKI